MTKLSNLTELKYFVRAISSRHSDESPADVIKSCKFLLDSLPAAREAILDYFATVFEGSTKSFLVQYHSKNAINEDKNIEEIKCTLENLVQNGPHAWAPLLSAWSLTLLGKILEVHGPQLPLTSKIHEDS